MNHAFTRLRGYARSHHLRLSDLARTVAEYTADLDAILRHPAEQLGRAHKWVAAEGRSRARSDAALRACCPVPS